jgi:hypothetical protein
MLEEKYPSESWVRVYTATNTTTKGGAGIYIQYLNGDQQSDAIAAGLHCSNYKDEGEDIIHTAHTIECKVDNNIQFVFLTDALSVLQPLMNVNLRSLNRRYSPSKPLEHCYSGSLLIVEFIVMNMLTDCAWCWTTTARKPNLPHSDEDHHQVSIQDSPATR